MNTAAAAAASQSTDTSNSRYAAQAACTSLKRARTMFGSEDTLAPPPIDPKLHAAAVRRRNPLHDSDGAAVAVSLTTKNNDAAGSTASGALVVVNGNTTSTNNQLAVSANITSKSNADKNKPIGGILTTKSSRFETTIPTPQWHAPWKLSTVLSSHLGWVQSIAFDPTNTLFATGSADSTIKLWNLPKASVGASDALQLTLTGHISSVRALQFSEKHPYLFSAAEDKTVKCWDLETNQVVRHYHGHLSGVYALKLHPTLDILVTAGRDAVARVWDMRTKTQLHVLSGHEHTVSSILTTSTHPQIVTGSHDKTVKLWDLAAGKCFTTLTHHQKAIRGLCAAPPALKERTFVSAGADCLRKWQGKNGRFLHKMTGHRAVINAVAAQDDGVLVSGGDDGTLHFWDYATGHTFQQVRSKVQPGSLQQAENGIYALQFDGTGTRLITGEADKSIKIYKPDAEASELTHPIDMKAWRKKCIAEAKERY